jgi:hypothetical protein
MSSINHLIIKPIRIRKINSILEMNLSLNPSIHQTKIITKQVLFIHPFVIKSNIRNVIDMILVPNLRMIFNTNNPNVNINLLPFIIICKYNQLILSLCTNTASFFGKRYESRTVTVQKSIYSISSKYSDICLTCMHFYLTLDTFVCTRIRVFHQTGDT